MENEMFKITSKLMAFAMVLSLTGVVQATTVTIDNFSNTAVSNSIGATGSTSSVTQLLSQQSSASSGGTRTINLSGEWSSKTLPYIGTVGNPEAFAGYSVNSPILGVSDPNAMGLYQNGYFKNTWNVQYQWIKGINLAPNSISGSGAKVEVTYTPITVKGLPIGSNSVNANTGVSITDQNTTIRSNQITVPGGFSGSSTSYNYTFNNSSGFNWNDVTGVSYNISETNTGIYASGYNIGSITAVSTPTPELSSIVPLTAGLIGIAGYGLKRRVYVHL